MPYFDPAKINVELLEGRDRLTWQFRDLAKMDMVWTQLMLALHVACPGKAMCIWCPHQWFDYSHGERNRQFMRANELSKHRRFHIIGGRTFLDRLAGEGLPPNSTHSFAPGPFEDLRSIYYTLIGEYLITVKLDKETTDRIEALFAAVTGEREMKRTNFNSFFGMPVRAKLTLEHDPKKTLKLKKKFADYFGESLNNLG